ncbi:helix-turn-helix domain-containing protein [Paenibacillus oleatilyticus]|uniref:helix-turn-helix domain-containing protein n=1 Tax=Paenibacillus oleatilyticus TaxID=2594886 RepID=UPI001C1F8ED8|nr:helix-turn-helix transcriptional regulator [Paenibacillus oleatilyticus]MBU7318219.1 helix-turn-helix domain-containing protein [Paenibacillus oleatilyticus]
MEKFVSSKEIVERIEYLIEANNIPKSDFLKEMGISSGNMGDWKSERSTPNIHKLVRVAEYFKVTLDWLVTGKDRPTKEGDSLGEKLQSVGSVHELSEDEKAFIREYIEFTAYRKQGKRG